MDDIRRLQKKHFADENDLPSIGKNPRGNISKEQYANRQ